MNIDIESILLLGLILTNAPVDRQYILSVIARSNSKPSQMKFPPNTEYPTFYGYYNERIPDYLQSKGLLNLIVNKNSVFGLLSASHLSWLEANINTSKVFNLSKISNDITQFMYLKNNTQYKDARVYLIFRDKALEYINDYVHKHKQEIVSFLGPQLSSQLSFKTSYQIQNSSNINNIWPEKTAVIGNKFVFDDKNYIEFKNNNSRFKIFKSLFDAQGNWVSVKKLESDSHARDTKRALRQIVAERIQGNNHSSAIKIEERTENGQAERRLVYSPSHTA